MAPKPSAQELKKQVREYLENLPEGMDPGRALTLLANDKGSVERLRKAFPKATPFELRQSLARLGGLLGSLQAWASKQPRAPEETETIAPETEIPDLPADDPSTLLAHKRVKVFIDGACKGNPGPSSIGIVVQDLEGATIYEEGRYLGRMTNNAAEYEGLIAALEILLANGAPETFVFSDSALMVNQVNQQWKVKHEGLRPLFNKVQSLKRKLKSFQIVHVPRTKNKRADELANLAIKQHRDASVL